MDEEKLKEHFARNLTALRKSKNLTQLQLAEKLNYSDKSVSKWEHGNVLPDIVTFRKIADFFKVRVDDLIASTTPKKATNMKRRVFATLLSCGLVFFVASVAFCILYFLNIKHPWLAFIACIPPIAIVSTILCSVWFGNIATAINVSAINWSVGVTLHLFILVLASKDLWLVYIVCSVFQILIILWYLMKRSKRTV